MAGIKYTHQGLTASDQYLTVHFTAEGSTWMRFGTVRVPIVALLQEQVTEAMDRAVRRSLIEAWSEQDLADPLF